ncbi:hypothetical protein PTKIN_Ptkin06aG0107100 [Pterospermum kingtungense]
MPVWLHLGDVPLELFTPDGLSYIASAVGNPLYTDRVTANRERVAFAKVCVEVDADSIIPTMIEVLMPEGNIVEITVEVPWLLVKCTNCKIFGHGDRFCPQKPKTMQEWRPVKARSGCVVDKVHKVANDDKGKVSSKASSVNRFTILNDVDINIATEIDKNTLVNSINSVATCSEFVPTDTDDVHTITDNTLKDKGKSVLKEVVNSINSVATCSEFVPIDTDAVHTITDNTLENKGKLVLKEVDNSDTVYVKQGQVVGSASVSLNDDVLIAVNNTESDDNKDVMESEKGFEQLLKRVPRVSANGLTAVMKAVKPQKRAGKNTKSKKSSILSGELSSTSK